MKAFIKPIIPILDILLLPFIFVASLLMKVYRRIGSEKLPSNTRLLKKVGVFPIRNHYYEPLFDDSQLRHSLSKKRDLPGIDFDLDGQIKFLESLTFLSEFDAFLSKEAIREDGFGFTLDNGSFLSGDAEFLFNFVRFTQPNRVIEIGSGASTKILAAALSKNHDESGNRAQHICVEPYEQPWLEAYPGIQLVREKVEDVDASVFENLQEGDFLFIDSSHMIRPQGDVLEEYLRIIPQLKKGVYVHVHDIFSPRDYLDHWVRDVVKFWNEQYLLEAMLSKNPRYKIVAALNFLKHEKFSVLQTVCPHMDKSREPGSFYFEIN